MFFFFIGGIQPKIKKVLQSNYGPCMQCRTGTMDHVEMAQTFYAFFLPVYSFSKQTLLYCNDCGFTTTPEDYRSLRNDPSAIQKTRSLQSQSSACRQCGSPINKGWSFCPSCGRQINT